MDLSTQVPVQHMLTEIGAALLPAVITATVPGNAAARVRLAAALRTE